MPPMSMNMTEAALIPRCSLPFYTGWPSAIGFGDEANIVYVAFRRAIRERYILPDFKDITFDRKRGYHIS